MFKDKIKELRKQNDYTQEDLAQKLNLSRQSISKWENGVSYPTKSTIRNICDIFEVDVNTILDQEELLFITVDNVRKLKGFKKNIWIISTSIISIIILIFIISFILNERIDGLSKIDEEPQDILDPILGYMILDENGEGQYLSGNSVSELMVTELFAYTYYDVEYKAIINNKVASVNYDYINLDNLKIDGNVYARALKQITIYKIKYDLENENMYLEQNHTYSVMAGSVKNHTFKNEKNDTVPINVTFDITIVFSDILVDVSLIEYNNKGEVLNQVALKDLENRNLSLNRDTLYYILEEIYRDEEGNTYLNKRYITSDDFKKIFIYRIIILDESNIFKSAPFSINTFI